MIRVGVIGIRGFQVNDFVFQIDFYVVGLQCHLILCASNLMFTYRTILVGLSNLQTLDHFGKDRGLVWLIDLTPTNIVIYLYYMVSIVSKYATSYICIYSLNLLCRF